MALATNAERDGREPSSEGIALTAYNVTAVLPDLPSAEDAMGDLRAVGLPAGAVTLRTRTLTDDPAASRVVPAVEAPTARRDLQVTGRVFSRVVLLAGAMAVAGAAIGFVIALILDLSTIMRIILPVVGAVAGAVLGGVWGGEVGVMTEAQKEEGVVVAAHCDDRATADRALDILRRHHPLRIDTYDGRGQPVRGG